MACATRSRTVLAHDSYTVLTFFGPRPETFNPVGVDPNTDTYDEHTRADGALNAPFVGALLDSFCVRAARGQELDVPDRVRQ